jgi:hypothetical protein
LELLQETIENKPIIEPMKPRKSKSIKFDNIKVVSVNQKVEIDEKLINFRKKSISMKKSKNAAYNFNTKLNILL